MHTVLLGVSFFMATWKRRLKNISHACIPQIISLPPHEQEISSFFFFFLIYFECRTILPTHYHIYFNLVLALKTKFLTRQITTELTYD